MSGHQLVGAEAMRDGASARSLLHTLPSLTPPQTGFLFCWGYKGELLRSRPHNQRRHPRNPAHWPCLLGPQLGQGQTFCQLLSAWTEQGFVSVQRAEPGGFQHTQELATGLCNLHFGVRVSTIGTATATTR